MKYKQIQATLTPMATTNLIEFSAFSTNSANISFQNMKNSLIILYDKLMLRKRSLIETVNDELKNVCQIEHTRQRSIDNFATNLLARLIAYNLMPKKPEMNKKSLTKAGLLCNTYVELTWIFKIFFKNFRFSELSIYLCIY